MERGKPTTPPTTTLSATTQINWMAHTHTQTSTNAIVLN